MSFRIYRLAEKEAKQGGSERGFAQTITRPGGQGAWIGDEASSRRSERTQEVEKGDGSAVVHETRMQADAPKRGGADFVCGVVELGDGEIVPGGLVHVLAVVLQHGHDDAVAGADIV